MSSLDSSKNLAGIGALLLLFFLVPGAGIVIGIIGAILLLMGVKGLATYYQDDEIYQDTLSGVILYIIALVAVGVGIVGLAFGGVFGGFTGLLGVGIGIFVFIGALVIAFIFYVLAAMRLRRAFSALAQKSGEHMFETAGFILYLGAILTIIFVGLALIIVAWILLLIAFFSIKVPPQPPQQPYGYTPPPTPQPTQVTRFCPNCGAPQDANATFCSHCGKQLPPA